MATYTEAFSEWWTAYPRKSAKRLSQMKWQIAIREIADDRNCSREEAALWLLERTKLFAASDKGKSGEYCPYPATWLFQGRYDDDVDEWGTKPSSTYRIPTAEEARRHTF